MTDTPRRQAFTMDDLTANEYGTLARLIGGDPMRALADADSVRGGDALSGLAMLQDRRDRSGVTWENYRDMTMRELQERLGIIGAGDAPATPEEVAQVLTEAGLAAQAEGPDDTEAVAAIVAGGDVDPSEPTGSPSSG